MQCPLRLRWVRLRAFTLCGSILFGVTPGCTPETHDPHPLRVDLGGMWDAAPEGASYSSIPRVAVPSNLYDQPSLRQSHTSTFHLRRRFVLPPHASGLGLRTGTISDADITRFNGSIIGINHHASGGPTAYDRTRIYPVPDSLLREGENAVEITVDAFFDHEAGILSGHPVIASLVDLYHEQMIDEISKVVSVCLLLTASFYFTLLYAWQRREPSSLWLSLFFLMLGAYLAHRSSLKYSSGLSLLALKRMEYVTLCLLASPLAEYFHATLPLPRHLQRPASALRWTVGAILMLTAVWIAMSSNLRAWDSFNVLVIQRILWPVLLAEAGLRLFSGLRQRQSNAALVSVGSILALSGGIADVLTHQGFWQAPRIAHLTFLAFPAGLAVIQVRRIVRMQHALEEWGRTLEQKVTERTAALRESLTRVEQLKERQDGDYYLTSLLLSPLSTQQPPRCSPSISLSLFCRQKKRFTFRGRPVELGGDINIVARIHLRKRSYLAVLNGDAMGKSLQGAGGALVLGTVFRSSLDRTPDVASDLRPEDWLIWCYEGLFNVFRSFEGSMMASAILALLDEENGIFYHLNAEHPRIVLTRARRAAFLCKRADLRRFGFALPPERPTVQTTRLHAGDVLFLGTDGRDDLLVCGKSTAGGESSERMNDDPELFLRSALHVQTQLADSHTDEEALPKLVQALEQAGSITDDLALIRIVWHGPAISAGMPEGHRVQPQGAGNRAEEIHPAKSDRRIA